MAWLGANKTISKIKSLHNYKGEFRKGEVSSNFWHHTIRFILTPTFLFLGIE